MSRTEGRQAGAVPECEITPQMIEAGKRELIESGILPFGMSGSEIGCEGSVVSDIYRAMQKAKVSA